ncbi:hypothetical protein [Donghicola sp.]|jgi:hypothetical protein|uniref:hypothetical protein n=1 Tax=Donghicola sp. TaxID=1929294 RepID=UPI0026008455|nr:hypothetical protein [Donghicola sp.]MCT4579587.1 hypothetical protein [Donghicola sp.]
MKILVTPDVSNVTILGLKKAGVSPEFPGCADEVAKVLQDDEATLIWQLPIESVASAYMSASSLAPVLTSWLAWHQDLLAVIRKYRRKLKLIDGSALLPGAIARERTVATEILGIETFEPSCEDLGANIRIVANTLSLHLLPELSLIYDSLEELRANSYATRRECRRVDEISEFSLAFDALRELENSLCIAKTREEEVTLLSEDIESQLEHALSVEASALRSAEDVRYLQSEVNRLIDELHESRVDQGALEELLSEQKQRSEQLQHDRNRLQGTIDELYRSSSWKVTRPMRAVRRMFS